MIPVKLTTIPLNTFQFHKVQPTIIITAPSKASTQVACVIYNNVNLCKNKRT